MKPLNRQDKAIDLFNQGHNCAQSVLLSFQDELSADRETAMNIASGFGAGMGRLQKTCGALTGSFMVISLFNSMVISNETERKNRTYELIQELEKDFSSQFGYSDCSLLTGVNLNTDEGQEEFSLAKNETKVCEKAIKACVSWQNKNLLGKSH